MIYTLTLNPALDYVIGVDHLKLGEVNRVNNEAILYGGKGINVSYILKELGFDSQCLGFVAGFTGDEIVRGTKEVLNLNADFIKVDQGLTRINIKLKSESETEINGIGPVVTQQDIEELLIRLDKLKDGDVLVLSGSIPSSMSQSIYHDILYRLNDKDVKVVVDATGKLLMETLKYKPFLIKPNNYELAELFDTELNSIDDIEVYARKLQALGARNVLISMAKDGSLLIDENGQCHVLGVCEGTVVNSVGAGDSMVGGFIAGYLSGLRYDETLKLATACGGATAFSKGLASRKFIYELLKQL